jgi:hypothetical protein
MLVGACFGLAAANQQPVLLLQERAHSLTDRPLNMLFMALIVDVWTSKHSVKLLVVLPA